jgi:hypothetical protein
VSSPAVLICDYCQGVIPEGAPCLRDISVTLVTREGQEQYEHLDFCCTPHLIAYAGTKLMVQPPAPLYKTLP